jgi:hypothetical protein
MGNYFCWIQCAQQVLLTFEVKPRRDKMWAPPSVVQMRAVARLVRTVVPQDA